MFRSQLNSHISAVRYVRLAWTAIFLFTLPVIAGMMGMCHHAQFLLVEMRSWKLWPGLALDCDPPGKQL
jgi:hypothetical protein